MFCMRRVRSEGDGPAIEDADTDERCRSTYVEPYLRELCLRNGSVSGESAGTEPTPLLDGVEEEMYGPVASPTFTSEVYDKHAGLVGNTDLELDGHGQSVERLKEVWEKNREMYEKVAAEVDLPAELIAALHYRESSFNFNTYLHQGDPLGRPAVHVPRNIPVFDEWGPAAVHALGLKRNVQKDVGLTKESNDLAAMGTYAEYYNGLGYDQRGISSPYVYGGTNQYDTGHYVADGRFDRNAKDRRLGVMPIVRILKGVVSSEELGEITNHSYSTGDRTLSMGEKGADVKELQALLIAGGAELKLDGDMGALTDEAVREFQEKSGLKVDGIVGPKTIKALRENAETQCTPDTTDPAEPNFAPFLGS